MTLVYCSPAGTLVEPRLWFPTESYDYVWGRFGCNQLRCGSCKQIVRSHVDAEKYCRHYECACQARDEYDLHELGSDADVDRPFETSWRCAGHPRLSLPVRLDGIEISTVGPFASIVSRALQDPPFVAPGFSSKSFWVQRLFRLLPTEAQQETVSRAVSFHFNSEDATTARSAMDFFCDIPWAAGGEQLAEVAFRESERLRGTSDPEEPKASLYDRILDAIECRLLSFQKPEEIDRPTLELARSALLRGEGTTDLIFAVSLRDSRWFAQAATKIVQAHSGELDIVLRALTDADEADRAHAVAEIRAIDEKTDSKVRRWFKKNGLRIDE